MDNQQSILKIDINVKFAYDQESTQMNYKDYNTELEQLKNNPRKTKSIKECIKDLENQIVDKENQNTCGLKGSIGFRLSISH
jgi:hypothetical protein